LVAVGGTDVDITALLDRRGIPELRKESPYHLLFELDGLEEIALLRSLERWGAAAKNWAGQGGRPTTLRGRGSTLGSAEVAGEVVARSDLMDFRDISFIGRMSKDALEAFVTQLEENELH
jgi:hypothetical protein